MSARFIIVSAVVASLNLVGAAPTTLSKDMGTSTNFNTNTLPSAQVSRVVGDYSTTCTDRFDVGFCRNNSYLKENFRCCRFGDQCGDLPRCDGDSCCVQRSRRATDPKITKACTCMGGVIQGRCHGNFKDLMASAQNNDIIYIGGDTLVKEPTNFGVSVVFQGVECDGKRASLIAKFDSPKEAMLQATTTGQVVEFRDLDFTSVGSNRAAAFHAGGTELDAGDQSMNASFYNVHMHDMQSEGFGVGIRIGYSLGLLIDADCSFENLVQNTTEAGRFAGGAAVVVIFLSEKSPLKIGGKFIRNKSYYPHPGSKHAGGGAVYLDYLAGPVEIDAEFTENEANEGGAMKIQGVLGDATIKGLFNSNKGVDHGSGSRGGAIRLNRIHNTGVVTLDAVCKNNTTPGRGGVIASNVQNFGSKLIIKGDYDHNSAGTDGGVWSLWSPTTVYKAQTLIMANSVFTNNESLDSPLETLYDMRDEVRVSRMADVNWKGDKTITV